MKLITFVIAFTPPVLVLAAKFAIEPMWMQEFSFLACLGLGAVMGAFASIAARVIEPQN